MNTIFSIITYLIRIILIITCIYLGIFILPESNNNLGYLFISLGCIYGFYCFYKDQLEQLSHLEIEIKTNLINYGFNSMRPSDSKLLEQKLENSLLDTEASFSIYDTLEKQDIRYYITFGKYRSAGRNFHIGWFVTISLPTDFFVGEHGTAISNGRNVDILKCLRIDKKSTPVMNRFLPLVDTLHSNLKFFSFEIIPTKLVISLDNYSLWESNTKQNFGELVVFLNTLGTQLNKYKP